MNMRKFHKIPIGKGASVENYGLGKHLATRYRYERKPVMHKGKLMQERLGFRGKEVVEVGFVPVKKRR